MSPAQHQNNSDAGGDKSSERPQSKLETKAENKERGEAAKEIADGALNKDIAAQTLEKRLSRKSGATDYGVASADSLLPKEPSKQRFVEAGSPLNIRGKEYKLDELTAQSLDTATDASDAKAAREAQVEQNYHRDIARQIKDAIKGTPHHSNHKESIDVQQKTEAPKELKVPVPSYQLAHPEAAPIDISPAVQNAKTDAMHAARTDINALWKPVEGTVIKANDLIQGHSNETQNWNDVDLLASEQAFKAFPKLAQYNLPNEVVAGLILNEVRHRDPKDMMEDISVSLFGSARTVTGKENPQASIGPGQLQVGTIKDLAAKYPQLQKFDDPVKAALEPNKAPFFVAAYLTERVSKLEEHNSTHPESRVNINLKSLLYSYNPDVLVKDGVDKPTLTDYRAITPAEKVENSITHKRTDTERGWHSVMYATNDFITEKSQVVKDMLEGIRSIREHKTVQAKSLSELQK